MLCCFGATLTICIKLLNYETDQLSAKEECLMTSMSPEVAEKNKGLATSVVDAVNYVFQENDAVDNGDNGP